MRAQTGGGLMKRRRDENDRGAVAIVVALFLIVFMLLLAFVVDFGRVYAKEAELQNTADAAALAAAQNLPNTTSAGTQVVSYVTSNNTANKSQVSVVSTSYTPLGSPDTVRVVVTEPVSLFFGGFVGRSSITPTATAVAKRNSAPGGKYGFYVSGAWDIRGGGNGLTILGAPAFAGSTILNGNEKYWVQYGIFTRTGATLSNGFFYQNPIIQNWPGTAAATTWLGLNSNQRKGQQNWTATATTTSFPDPDVPLTACEYADLIDLHDCDGLPDAGDNPPGVDEGDVNRLMAFKPTAAPASNPPGTATWRVVQASTGGNAKCEINLSRLASGIKGVSCSNPNVPFEVLGTGPSSVEMVQHSNLIRVMDDIDWNGSTCQGHVILYGTGGAANVQWSGNDKTLCGTVYMPTASLVSNGNGATIREGRVITAGFASNGTAGNFTVLPPGDPYASSSSAVQLIE